MTQETTITWKTVKHGSLGWCYLRGQEHRGYNWASSHPFSVTRTSPTPEQQEAYHAGFQGKPFPSNLDPNARPDGPWQD